MRARGDLSGDRLWLVARRMTLTSGAAALLLLASAGGRALTGSEAWTVLGFCSAYIQFVTLGQWVRVARECLDMPWLRALDTARAYLADEEPAR